MLRRYRRCLVTRSSLNDIQVEQVHRKERVHCKRRMEVDDEDQSNRRNSGMRTLLQGLQGRWYGIVVILGMILLAGVLPAATVSAAGCSGTGCNGRDPVAMGCNGDAYTVTSADIKSSNGQTIGRVDLRWSPGCRTNWGRVTSYVGSSNLFVLLTDCNGNEVPGTYYELAGTTAVYGDMKYNTTVRAKGAFGLSHASGLFNSTGCY